MIDVLPKQAAAALSCDLATVEKALALKGCPTAEKFHREDNYLAKLKRFMQRKKLLSADDSGPQCAAKPITTAELQEALQVSRKTVQQWRKAGAPCQLRPGKATLWDLEAVKDWLLHSGNRFAGHILASATTTEQQPAAGAEEPAGDPPADDTPISSAEELEQLKLHCMHAETGAFDRWQTAQKENKPAAECIVLQRAWEQAAQRSRQVLKDYPDLMIKFSRFRDTEDVRLALSTVAQIFGNAMDNLGTVLAEPLEGLDANQRRILIDDEVAKHREALLREIRELQDL